jgi:YD repeat-containing protein
MSRGNVTAEGGKTFTYDSQNEMLTMSASGTAVTLLYHGDGNRVAKTVNGVTTQYLAGGPGLRRANSPQMIGWPMSRL